MSKAIVRYLNSRSGRDGSHSLHHYCIPTPFDSVNTLTPLNGKGAVKKLVNFRRFVGFR